MLSCRQVSRLVSQSMEARLPWYQRVGVRFHLLYCVWCRRYAAQLQFLRKAAKVLDTGAADATPALSAEAKEKMRQRLAEARADPPSPPR